MERKVFGFALKWVLLVAALIAVLLYVASISGLFAKRDAHNAKAGTIAAEGEASVAQDVSKAAIDQAKAEAAGAIETDRQVDEIQDAKGAKDAVPADVNSAFRKSMCLREPYRSKPACTGSRGLPAP